MTLTPEILRDVVEDIVDTRINELENELSNIRSTLTAQYLNSLGRVLAREAKETIASFACAYHPATENQCKGSLNNFISKYTNSLMLGEMAEAFSILTDLEKTARKNSEDTDKNVKCANDWAEIHKIVTRHIDIAKDISAQFTSRRVPADIGELNFDAEEMYKEVVFPLSHELRIKIIHALKSGSKRFTTLKNELDVKNTGLLVHHLKPLTDYGLVDQDYRKEYSLTDKGFMVARYFAQIAAAMHPEEIKTVTIGSHPQVTKLEVINQ